MQLPREKFDADALRVVERLRRANHQAYLVGGCVRDVLLDRRPKDFDVATSATPNEIRRVFRNCRIIGRRFRLAHVFFGPKIIETATFRGNPNSTEGSDDDKEAAEAETGDLLIKRDNVFGTEEEDARRRDFTINGLFYDSDKGEVIDHVDGLADIEKRIVRTIGDPDIRFREDPVRILRAIKFAARCELTIEPETLRRMSEHRDEIARCPPARVSEELFRLFRASAARRSLELLIETSLLPVLLPELARGLEGEPADETAAARRQRLWGYLAALDARVSARPAPASNALILATILLPPLRDSLDPASTGVGDIGQLVAQAIAPFAERIRASRRDTELARQALLAQRFLLPSATTATRRKPRLEGREFYSDALTLAEIVVAAEGLEPLVAARPMSGLATDEEAGADEAAAQELERAEPERGRGRRFGGDRGPRDGAPRVQATAEPERRGPTPIPSPQPRLAPPLPFLGDGGFGGPWATLRD